MTILNNDELRTKVENLLEFYGICKCGKLMESSNYPYHVCKEQGLLFKIMVEVESEKAKAVEEARIIMKSDKTKYYEGEMK